MPDVPEGKPRTVVSGRCPLTDQVEKLTQQMAEVMSRLSALESIRMQSKVCGRAGRAGRWWWRVAGGGAVEGRWWCGPSSGGNAVMRHAL